MEQKALKPVGVVGSGVMGHGIAMTFAKYGFQTIMYDISDDFLKKALENISSGRFGLQKLVDKGSITASGMSEIMGRITITTSLRDLAGCSLVVEAAPENRDLKGKNPFFRSSLYRI